MVTVVIVINMSPLQKPGKKPEESVSPFLLQEELEN